MQDPVCASGDDEGTSGAAWQSDDAELLQLLAESAQGSTSAFAALYDRTARWLLAEVRNIVRDGQAEDVLAETYLQIWRTVLTYEKRRAPPRAWLKMIARSRALDHLRRERRHGHGSASDSGSSPDGVDTADNPEQALARAEESRLLQSCMITLAPEERTVVALAYFREHTQLEIASITGLPTGTVKTIMSRAQAKLRIALAAVSMVCQNAIAAAPP